MADYLIKGDGFQIQHGKDNDRVYIMKFSSDNTEQVIDITNELVSSHSYSKVFAKVPEKAAWDFVEAGYRQEAYIPGYYSGNTACLLMKKYISEAAQFVQPEERGFFDRNVLWSEETSLGKLEAEYSIRPITEEELGVLLDLYTQVFPHYPFPISDLEYLTGSLAWTKYFGVFTSDGELAGAASMEMDKNYLNAELTDFAVYPKYRGMGFARFLLNEMEKDLIAKGYKTGYTIARLREPGMNKTFAKQGYRFSGCLINNTKIMTGIESMNVWYKNF